VNPERPASLTGEDLALRSAAVGERLDHARPRAAVGSAKNRVEISGWVPGYRRSRWKWYPVRPAVTSL
jgi:hypothetical protein